MDKEFEKEIKKIREDLKEIKSDLKTFLTDETSKDYVQQLIDNVNKGNLNVGDLLTEEEESLHQEYLDQWTCDICGKHTHKVEYDYLGNGTNHLACELKDEIAAMEAGVDVKASKESN
jgi:predicted flavoprotein YhiN